MAAIDLQKASMWKRTAAWLFDSILFSILAVGLVYLLSITLGYDTYNNNLNNAYARYEGEYGIVFDISPEEYNTMPEQKRQAYDDAYDALIADEEAVYAYMMVSNLTLLMVTMGILFAILILEFIVPLKLGNGQTLGKKIFSIGVMHLEGIRLSATQLFMRSMLGKFTIELMLPIYIFMMILWGAIGFTGTMLLFALAAVQLICVTVKKTNPFIHDLLAGTVVVDITSQAIFASRQDLIEHQKRMAAQRAAQQEY